MLQRGRYRMERKVSIIDEFYIFYPMEIHVQRTCRKIALVLDFQKIFIFFIFFFF